MTVQSGGSYDAEFRALRDSLREITSRVERLAQAQYATKSKAEIAAAGIAEVSRETRAISSELTGMRSELTAYINEDRRARNLQLARTALVDIRAERDRLFGHHNAVRDTVLGMLRAMDLGVVTHATMQQRAEQLMINKSDFWLVPVPVALAAWNRNNKMLAERALFEAIYRDRYKTALFFSLVLGRHHRYGASAQWIERYLNEQESHRLSDEFVVVLDAVAVGALGDAAKQIVQDRCVQWYRQLKLTDGLVDEQVVRWRKQLDTQRVPLGDRFPVLSTVCSDWKGTLRWAEGATVHGATERLLRVRFETVPVPDSDRRRRVDQILDNLIRRREDAEAVLDRREAKWTAVWDSGGDAPASTPTPAAEAPRKTANLLSLLTSIALQPRHTGASVATQQLALALAGEWIENAAVELSARSRRDKPEAVPIVINEWDCRIRPTDTIDDLSPRHREFIDQKVAAELRQITIRGPFAFLLISAALLPLSGAWLAGDFPRFLPMFALAASLLTLVFAVLWFRQAREDLPERRSRIRNAGEALKAKGDRELAAALDEVRQLYACWEEEIAKERSLVTFVRGCSVLNPALAAGSTDEIPLEAPASARNTPPYGPATPAGAAAVTGTNGGTGTSGGTPAGGTSTGQQHLAVNLPGWDLLPPGPPEAAPATFNGT